MGNEIKEGAAPALKRGYNIYLYYWTIPVFLAFIAINYFSQNFRLENFDASLMISIVSFLFGFLITIAFSMLLARVSAVKGALSDETGRIVSLYLLSKQLGEKFHERIKECIDEYTICTLRDYTTYELSREPFYRLYKEAENMEIKTKEQEAAASSFFYVLGELEPVREKLESLTSRRVEWSIKFANYLLGIVLIVLLFINRADTFTNTLFIILSTTVIFIFLIIEDYDDLRIGDYTYNISNAEQIFDLIEKPRYYPESSLSRARLVNGQTYRIGIFDEKTKQEKIFTIDYTPQFHTKIAFLTKKLRRE